MFVRVKTTPNSPRKSVQIVENNRLPDGKIKQKIVRYVGIAMDDSEEEKLKSLALEIIAKLKAEQEEANPQLSLFETPSEEEMLEEIKHKNNKKLGRKPKKRIEDILPVDQVTLDQITEEKRIIEGINEVAGKVYDDLGYNKVLQSKHSKNAKYSQILKDLVLARISDPASKHKTQEILLTKQDKDYDLDTIYRVLDEVHHKIEDIKVRTFNNTVSLLKQELDIVLFDVTTLHFESVEVDELRNFGYSKNCKFNNTQVVLALATNLDGLPIGYELFEGNKAEVKTLLESINKWHQLFDIKGVTFVGDRAMFSEDNMKLLEEKGYEYVIAAKIKGTNEIMQAKILAEKNYLIHKIDEDIGWVGEFKYDDEDLVKGQELGYSSSRMNSLKETIVRNNDRRIIVSYTSKRARKDLRDRSRQLEKIEKIIGKEEKTATTKLVTNSAIKKYTTNKGKGESELNKEKIAEESKWDGLHGVITNISKEKEGNIVNILKKYRNLTKIEDCFRVNKTDLKMRPIFHHKSERIQAHVAICYIAFALIRQIEYRVMLTKKISPARIIDALNSVQSSIYEHKITKDRYRVPGAFSNEARKIYQALGIDRGAEAHIYNP